MTNRTKRGRAVVDHIAALTDPQVIEQHRALMR
ncbi:hypothetical protein [Nocardiopsis ansamitocini]